LSSRTFNKNNYGLQSDKDDLRRIKGRNQSMGLALKKVRSCNGFHVLSYEKGKSTQDKPLKN